MSKADGTGDTPSEQSHSNTHYSLSVSSGAGHLTVWVSAGPDGPAHQFSSLLLAFDYIERDLAASPPGSGGGLR